MEKKKASIVAIRKDHGKRSNEGNTLETLNNLILRIRGFYERLTTLKTKLWDRSDLHNAESLVYSRAVYYFGLELFSPITTTDESVRAEKEQKLDLALWRLSVLFANPYQEDYKREQIVHEMESLLNELRLPKADSVGIPGMSFLGGLVQFTTPEGLLSPGLGRLGDQLSWIIGKLQASVTVSSKELASVSSSITTTLKVPEVDSNLSLLGHLSFFPPISSAPQITIIDDNYDSATKSIAEGAVSKAG